MFGVQAVAGRKISVTEISCTTPTSLFDKTSIVQFTLKPNNSPSLVVRGYNLTFTYVVDPVVTRLSIRKGSKGGKTLVTLSGTYDVNHHIRGCKFGIDGVGGILERFSPTEIACMSNPSSVVGTVQIFLTYNMLDWLSTGFTFEYYIPISIASVTPLIGVSNGGTVLKLTATEPSLSKVTLQCIFGSESVLSKQISPSDFECISPENLQGILPPSHVVTFSSYRLHLGGMVSLSFTMNEVDYLDHSFQYTYIAGTVVYKLFPQNGVVTGGSVVQISGANIHNDEVIGANCYCVFGDTAVLGVVISTSLLTCVTPASQIDSAEDVPVSVYHMRDISLQTFQMTRAILAQYATKATGDLLFSYERAVAVKTVYPFVLFENRANVVHVAVEDIGLSSSLSCVWLRSASLYSANGEMNPLNSTSFTSGNKLNNSFVSCQTPADTSKGTLGLTISTNGFIETQSVVTVTFVPEPMLTSVRPNRILEGSSSLVTLSGSNIPMDYKTSCVFIGNDNVRSLAKVLSNRTVTCPLPSDLMPSQEIQRISIAGLAPTSEIQVLDVTSITDQTEIQRIRLSSWGTRDAIWEIRAGSNIPTASKAVATITTELGYKSEVQDIKIFPSAYRQEVQLIRITVPSVLVIPMENVNDEDNGTMVVKLGSWEARVYWNISEVNLANVLMTSLKIQGASVTKTTTNGAILNGRMATVQIAWNITFSPCDGNVSSLSLSGASIPRSSGTGTFSSDFHMKFPCLK
jgi:IPT/TIG domain